MSKHLYTLNKFIIPFHLLERCSEKEAAVRTWGAVKSQTYYFFNIASHAR